MYEKGSLVGILVLGRARLVGFYHMHLLRSNLSVRTQIGMKIQRSNGTLLPFPIWTW